MKKFVYYYLSTIPLQLAPAITIAQTIDSVLDEVESILPGIIQVLILLATVVFLLGIITYITAGGDEKKLSEGKKYMLWGIVGVFVMVAMWGIVMLIVNTFNLGGGQIPIGPGEGPINL